MQHLAEQERDGTEQCTRCFNADGSRPQDAELMKKYLELVNGGASENMALAGIRCPHEANSGLVV